MSSTILRTKTKSQMADLSNSSGNTLFPPIESTHPSPPSSLSDKEATFYYAGLPSSPRLVARTSTFIWAEPTGPEAYRKLKQLRVVVNHKLNTVWENNVAPKVHACLDAMGVQWTSTDIVRIGIVGESSAPVVLWIGVKPESLVGVDAKTAAFGCLDVLIESDITDVHVEMRESLVTCSAGPMLLPPDVFNTTAAIRHPLTHALGLPISAEARPNAGGTGGFFMAEGGDSNKLFLVTARHVVFPQNKETNIQFDYKNDSQPRQNVLILGDKAYENCLASIWTGIEDQREISEYWERRFKAAEKKDGKRADIERARAQNEMDEAEVATEELHALYNDVKTNWASYASRVLGHVVYSPPIRVGAGTAAEQYIEDYAIIELNDDKIDRTEFDGNVIDLGTEIPISQFTKKMYPNPKNRSTFKYPTNRLLKLRGTIEDDELRNPTSLDQNDDPCLMVIKNGSTTGVTIGRASGIMSFVRYYFDVNSHETSKEWAILPCDTKSGAFSEPGDSGAVIVDGLGRIGGLLTSGSGFTSSSDITYATPITFLKKSIKAKYPSAHLNPAGLTPDIGSQ